MGKESTLLNYVEWKVCPVFSYDDQAVILKSGPEARLSGRDSKGRHLT
jgi:hypothetical protein